MLFPFNCHTIVGNGTPITVHVKITSEEMLYLPPPYIVSLVGLTMYD